MISAEILLDSVNPSGNRLTTWELTFHRFVLAEVNTHRAFCLAGDSTLEFDLPAGTYRGGRRVYKMSISDLVDKWHNGARRTKKKPRVPVPAIIRNNKEYTTQELSEIMGFAGAFNINTACRTGRLRAWKHKDGRAWIVLGRDFREWRSDEPPHSRFDLRERLSSMQIRQLDERTGLISTSHIKDCCFSGNKEIFEVTAGGHHISGSADHLILTDTGYERVADLIPGQTQIVVSRFGLLDGDHTDPLRLKKFGERWRTSWQQLMRLALIKKHGKCMNCGSFDDLDAHHVIPVHIDLSRAFDESNLELLCQSCHHEKHVIQGWQASQYLYGTLVTVDSVIYRGSGPTYDLEIAGDFQNFLANHVVVHNSRNAASSRAVPVERMIQRAADNPAMPVFWGKNQKGMQAQEELSGSEQQNAQDIWLDAMRDAIYHARRLATLGVHKSLTNRLIEPFLYVTNICSATEFENFFTLRAHPDAQPEISDLALKMLERYRSHHPTLLQPGEWHIPMLFPDEADLSTDMKLMLATARCARVSYFTHDGKRDHAEDLRLYDQLKQSGHWSPFEHCAMALDSPRRVRNMVGWRQYRTQVDGETVAEPPHIS